MNLKVAGIKVISLAVYNVAAYDYGNAVNCIPYVVFVPDLSLQFNNTLLV